ncbi:MULTISPECIES: hypothetical protein [Pseudomonas]|uniref:Uncharacterized protein n=1 Tax=Pseudomonas fluorescens TaxID=294 RepID=A0A166QND4_PSEFL|nr:MULTISPECIES: hypothetical protein [Pseudomonas]KZN20581.1 hypothetical protein A1D17_03315 [Pseudomonas fluorescens]
MSSAPYNLTQSNAPKIALIFDGLCRIHHKVRADRHAANLHTYADEVGTSEERLLSACLMIAALVADRLQPAVDHYQDRFGHGSFVYDHLDYNENEGAASCASLPAFIWRFLDAEHPYWRVAAESLLPHTLPLDRILADWRKASNLI